MLVPATLAGRALREVGEARLGIRGRRRGHWKSYRDGLLADRDSFLSAELSMAAFRSSCRSGRFDAAAASLAIFFNNRRFAAFVVDFRRTPTAPLTNQSGHLITG
jgi:hypothetical protein